MREKTIQKSYWLEQGTILNKRYRIDKVLEEGGFGIVYLGYDLILNMKVSIKEYFPREMADRVRGAVEILPYKGEAERFFRDGLEKFLSEARILAKCTQIENVVIVRDFFYANHTAYIIMEYVQGINIRDYVKQKGRMEPGEVLDYMEPILRSLIQIHQTGLIHRDISPENIIITHGKKLYLIDFGSTRPYTGEDYQTMTIFFKRGYAAEEQYREKGEQGPWTDVYSLCATMYFMLTNTIPIESVQRNIRDTLEPLTRNRTPNMPARQRKAIMKGLAVKYQKRYQNVAQLYRALYCQDDWGGMLRSVWKQAVFCSVVLGILCGGVVLRASYKDPQWKGTSDVAQVTVTAPSVTAARQTAAPSTEYLDDTQSQYMIPDVVGQSLSVAKERIRKNGDKGLVITVQKKYSTKVEKGKIIKQSIHGGVYYVTGDIQEIILTVSRGKQAESKTMAPKQEDIPKRTSAPKATDPPSATPKKNTQKKAPGNYAGDLPF